MPRQSDASIRKVVEHAFGAGFCTWTVRMWVKPHHGEDDTFLERLQHEAQVVIADEIHVGGHDGLVLVVGLCSILVAHLHSHHPLRAVHPDQRQTAVRMHCFGVRLSLIHI